MFITQYGRYKHKIFTHFVYRVGGDGDIAEDLASTTFLKAYEAYVTYDNSYAFSTWIYTIAHNVLQDYYRKENNQPTVDVEDEVLEDVLSGDEDLELSIDQKMTFEKVVDAFARLPEIGRRCMVYRYIDDFSTKEIAELTDLSEVAVRKHLSRNVQRLQKYFEVTN